MAVAVRSDLPLVVIGNREVLEASIAGNGIRLPDYVPGGPANGPSLLHMPAAVPTVPGRLDVRNADYVVALLDRACRGCRDGEFGAMVTAPVHKGILLEAGLGFTGHTGYLADWFGVERVVMMQVGGGLRVALATTHLPLRAVPDAITRSGLARTLRILNADLRTRFGIPRPRILVAGLNPHAGESGHMGREELDVIEPVLHEMRGEGFDLTGPLPADTLFQPRYLEAADAVLAMYHDQGLPVLKFASFGHGVNVTLGLPVVRTSVDHGTALDLAGTGRADTGSLHAALDLASRLHPAEALAATA